MVWEEVVDDDEERWRKRRARRGEGVVRSRGRDKGGAIKEEK